MILLQDLALGGGYDSSGQPESFAALGEALRRNLTTRSLIAQSFGRVFYARLKLGLLDPPNAVRKTYDLFPYNL